MSYDSASCIYTCNCTSTAFSVNSLVYSKSELVSSSFVANLYAKQWRKPVNQGEELPPKVFHIRPNSPTFGEYYDGVQELLKAMAGMDELLQGMYMYHIQMNSQCTFTLTCINELSLTHLSMML